MAKVYARDPGAEIRVGNFGVATETVPVEVPQEVAAELAANPSLRVEGDSGWTITAGLNDKVDFGGVAATLPPGIYETREKLDAAIETARKRARSKKEE